MSGARAGRLTGGAEGGRPGRYGRGAEEESRWRPRILLSVADRYRIQLSDGEERELRRRAAQYTRSHRDVVRAKIVLLSAAGHTAGEIARRLDCTEKSVHKWRRRFAQERIVGLEERPRPGRPRSSPHGHIARGERASPRLAA